MSEVLRLGEWGGVEARRWNVCSCRDAMVDVVKIGIGFLPDPQRKELSEAYHQLCMAQPASRVKLLGDFETRSWLALIQSKLAQGSLPYIEARSESAGGFDFIKRLALAAAVMERQPYQCRLETPGSRLRLPGIGSRLKLQVDDYPYLLIEADEHGEIRCTYGDILISPANCVSGFEVLLADGEVHLPLEDGYEALTEAEADWVRWEGLMDKVAALLAAQASAERLVRELVQGIVPLRASSTGSHLSSSFRDLPGVVSLDLSNEIDVAEALVHEADHQRFYIQTMVEPVWGHDQEDLVIYRSPWRPDPRPLDGLLAGASAFATVASFWAQVVAALHTRLLAPEDLGRRATYAMLQVEEAAGVIRRYGRLTPEGVRFLSVVEDRNRQARTELEMQADFVRWQEEGLLRRQAHHREWAQRHSCAGEFLSTSTAARA